MIRIAILCAFLIAASAGAVVVEDGADFTVWTVASGLDADAYQPASAVNYVHGHYMLLWSEDAGDAGFRIVGAAIDGATNAPVTFPAQLDSGIGNARQCAAAFDRTSEHYLAVWEQDVEAPGAYEIYGVLLASDMTPEGAPFPISQAGGDPADPAFDAHNPSVVADGEGHFLVVWAQDDDVAGFGDGIFDIYSRKISADGTLHGSGNQRLTDVSAGGSSPTNDALDPEVIFNLAVEGYGIVYEADIDGGLFYDPNVWLLPVGLDGVPKRATPPILVSQVGGSGKKDDVFYAKNPDIAYDTRQKQMLVVWDAGDGVSESVGSRILYSDYSVAPTIVQLSELSPNICISRDATVVYNLHSDSFLVGWSGTPSPSACPGPRQFLVREVDNAGNALGVLPSVISDTGVSLDPNLTATSPDLVPNPVNDGLMAWWSGDRQIVGEFELFGQWLLLGTSTGVEGDRPNDLPKSLELSAAPNPFNPRTVLRFGLPKSGPVRLSLYDVRGQLIRVLVDEVLPAGRHERSWNGRDHSGSTVASGVYFTRLEHAGNSRNMRVVLLK